MPKQLTQALIEQWIALSNRNFNVREIWAELGIASEQGKQHLRVILSRLDKVVEPLGYGNYRTIDSKLEKIDWQNADPQNIVDLKYPFELEKYALVYPKNVIVIAGAKQQGKSTFLYNFIRLNMYKYTIDLFNSETGAEQMNDRFNDLGIPLDAPINVYQRYDNFADVLNPKHLTVIDYLDVNSEFYLVGAEIDAIFRKTDNVVVIGMQIPPPSVTFVKGVKKIIDRDYAYGGGGTAKRAFIYVSMTSHKLKLKHVKKPAQKNVNPENMTWSYAFDDKGQFTNIQRYYEKEPLYNF